MTSTAIKTKYGTASIDSHGYYRIKTWKEGNNNKLLHRLIFEDFYQIKLPSNIIIHHDLKKGLDWVIVDETKAKQVCKEYGYDYWELC